MSRSESSGATFTVRATPSALRIYLLGPFECWQGETLIARDAWRTRPTLTLLKVLLDERDRIVTFDRLIDSVWPDSDQDAARHSLRVAIQTLRRVLEPDLSRGSASRFIRTEPTGYRFASQGCSIDVNGFLAARQRAFSAESRGDSAAAVAAFLEATSL